MAHTRGWSTEQVVVDHVAAHSTSPATYPLTESERVIGGRLPRSAYTRTWWHGSKNDGRRPRAAGWRVARVDRPEGPVIVAHVTAG